MIASRQALRCEAPRNYFDDKITHHFSILACHHYPHPLSAPLDGQLRAGAHTDFGAFTILAMQDNGASTGGLEVCMPDGRWRQLRARRGQLVVNLGDMMARWTNDRWVSTLHRVASPVAGEAPEAGRSLHASLRSSIGYFMHPDYGAQVRCLPNVLGMGETSTYPPTTAGEHIRAKIARTHGDS